MLKNLKRCLTIILLITTMQGMAKSENTVLSVLEPIRIKTDSKRVPINYYAHYYLSSPTQNLAVHDVLRLDSSHFRTINDDALFLGNSAASLWIVLQIENANDEDNALVVLYDYPPVDRLDFYLFDQQLRLIKQRKTGDALDFSSRDIKHSSFAIRSLFAPGEVQTLVIKVQSQGHLIAPISLWDEAEFTHYQIYHYLIFGILIGILIITCVYNLLVFIRNKERLFLYFALFILSFICLVSQQTGFGLQFIWPDSPNFNQFFTLLSVALLGMGHLVFSVKFLGIGKYWLKALIVIAGLNISLVILSTLVLYHIVIELSLAINTLSMLLTLSFAVSRAGVSKNALLYTLAWAPFIIGLCISASIRFGLIEYSIYSEYAGLFLAIITAIWLSMAIAERISSERAYRLSAQKQAISNMRLYEDLFDNSVAGVFNVTPSGHLIRASHSLVNILAYDNRTALFKHLGKGLELMFKRNSVFFELLKKLESSGEIIDYEVELKRQSGQVFWASLSLRLFLSDQQHIVQGAILDISARKVSELRLNYLASHDPLTNLFNRREFEQQLDKFLAMERAQGLTVLYMDLDQFKVVNDTCGHTVGDKLLIELSRTMMNTLAQRGILARLGGDEFGVILADTSANDALLIAEELLHTITTFEFSFEDRIFYLGVSIGLVEVTPDMRSSETIMSFVDTACYAAKDAGRNNIHIYSQDNLELIQRREEMELVSQINAALMHDGFLLYRQRIAKTEESHSLVSCEILVRMTNTAGEVVPPLHFIPSAERYGLMQKIDMHVIETTFAWLNSSPEELVLLDYCSINLSGQSIGSPKILAHIKHCFERYRIPHHKICFEVTETHAVSNLKATQGFIKELRKLGCRFALDDFGTGLSSYAYLRSLEIDFIKIDGCFIKDMLNSKADFALVQSIHTVAKAMNKLTIAEYVENEELIAALKTIGIDYLQGYAIDKPKALNKGGS